MACRQDNPQIAFERAQASFQHGDFLQSQQAGEAGYRRFLRSQPAWAWKFRTLQAESLLWRGMSEEALNLLREFPSPPPDTSTAIYALAVQSVAQSRLHLPEAEKSLSQAEQMCRSHDDPACGMVARAQGIVAVGHGDLTGARVFFGQSLSFARAHADRFLEVTALGNLGLVAMVEEHFDEAKDKSDAAYQAAVSMGAKRVAVTARGNSGWASYKLGDFEGALAAFQEAEKTAAQIGDVFDQENELTNIGYIHMDAERFDLAGQSFQKALALANSIKARQDTYNALRVLARLAFETDDLQRASQYAQQALEIARESGNHADELYPVLVQGQMLARQGRETEAEKIFRQVEGDRLCPVFLKWEAEHRLAQLYENAKHFDAADREYRTALSTFEAARNSVRHEDSQLSFLTNAAHIYDDYVHFLIERGKTGEALRWADYSRAQTLAEGLGLLARKSGNRGNSEPSALNAQQIARSMKGAILFYWLGEKQSYLWAIAPEKTQLFPLPPSAQIEATVQRYRRALAGPQDVLASANQDGVALYRMLVAPVQALLDDCSAGASPAVVGAPRPHLAERLSHVSRFSRRGTLHSSVGALPTLPKEPRCSGPEKIVVIPDGDLNNLNFETLIVPEPAPHFWIEDAIVADASSLRLLGTAHAPHKETGRQLLLVGNSIAPSEEYPELPKAEVQMQSVAQHFSADDRHVFSRAHATPSAYLSSHPEQYSYIHFVAHGTASRLSPLDSAIVLSREPAANDSFKLYARDIIQHPLHADLVTISACYGAGERSYSGEGLVGLSWAFLRAGAHNVIAALWEATDASTEQLMTDFYDELGKGASPDAALRSAKLALLHGNFRNPFYWAPFQLYTGS